MLRGIVITKITSYTGPAWLASGFAVGVLEGLPEESLESACSFACLKRSLTVFPDAAGVLDGAAVSTDRLLTDTD